ncbi:MAG: hypothetical protein NT091_01405 [Candidatus Falkowbacteria bacterium]|nr:hypothetical protein [Candidatus Falkowbacteria bacterium]
MAILFENNILNKLIDYTIFNHAQEVDIDTENGNIEVKIISEVNTEDILINPQEKQALIQYLSHTDLKRKEYLFNNHIYILDFDTFSKDEGQRIFIHIHPLNFKSTKINQLNLNKSQQDYINNYLNLPMKFSILTGSNTEDASSVIYGLLNEIDHEKHDVYLIDQNNRQLLNGIHSLKINHTNPSAYDQALESIIKLKPSLIALINPHPQIIRALVNTANNGTPVLVYLDANTITEIIVNLIKSHVNQKELTNALNFIALQTQN